MSSSDDEFVVLSLLKKEKKILSSSNPKNKTRARRVSPADEGAAEISQSAPFVIQDVSGPVGYAASFTETRH